MYKKHFIYTEKLDDERAVKEEELLKYFSLGYRLGRRPFTKEHIQNISEALTGKKLPKEHCQNISESQKKLKKIYNEKLDIETAVKKEDLQKYFEMGYRLGTRPFSEEHIQNLKKPKSEEARKNIRLGVIKRIEEINGYIYPGYNPEGCKYFNLLMKQTNTYIQHAENGGEFRIKELGFWVDGYDKKNNIVYEYDEAKHYNTNGLLKEKDVRRQKEITELLDCKFIRIKENELESIL